MSPLATLYHSLDSNHACSCLPDSTYFLDLGNGIESMMEGDSLILVGQDEYLTVSLGENEKAYVVYFGNDAKKMRETIDSLGLSDDSAKDIGEKVFHDFRKRLDAKYGPCFLEEKIDVRSVTELNTIISRFIEEKSNCRNDIYG